MLKPSVYIETSIIGYLASRPSRDLQVAACQQITHQWWAEVRERVEVFVSVFVVAECEAGDPVAAAERKVFLDDVPVLAAGKSVPQVAERLMAERAFPAKARIDALHVAAAATAGLDYLMTWNCKHIANPAVRRIIERTLVSLELAPPLICTPQELFNVG